MDYSVVIPVFNSEKSLEELFLRIKSTFDIFEDEVLFEIIFVDDFSKDTSWKILKKLKSEFPDRVKIIRFAKNYGQHNATFCGFQYATGNYVITIDDDLQYAPEDIPLLVQKIKSEHLDLVYGIGNKSHSFMRKIGSDFYKFNAKRVEKSLGEGSSFRVLTKELVQKILSHQQYFMYIDELLFWYTDHISFANVRHHKRNIGDSGYDASKLFKMTAQSTLLFGRWPLKLMIWFGSIFSILSFLVGVFYILKKIFLGANVPGYTSLIVGISFSTSLILLCFGIIGYYLASIHLILNKKPPYSIKEKL
ncbi:MAG TPA: glycosyltransferase family 2 protein [Flavobacteriaceae bacterium]|nr:glycosyltransferase family 2 protein [Flavobacteriaceae bacterium]